MKNWAKKSACSSHFFFPRICLHCEGSLSVDSNHFCEECTYHLDLLSGDDRCKRCFDLKERILHCKGCNSSPYLKSAAALPYYGPAQALHNWLNQGAFNIVEACAGFIAAQILQLNWPMPDMIIPSPLHWTVRFGMTFRPSKSIARELARILCVPMVDGLKHYAPVTINPSPVKLRSKDVVYNKRVLVLSDMASGDLYNACGFAVLEGSPKEVYGIGLCKKDLSTFSP